MQVVQRWILAKLRNGLFHTLDDLNVAIRQLNLELNEKIMRHLGKTRSELFASVDMPNALKLPDEPFQIYKWSKARVGIDYCIQIEKHYYSVPYKYVDEEVCVRLYEKSVEVFLKTQRIANHIRSFESFAHTILKEHMPEKHRKHLELYRKLWLANRTSKWAFGLH